MNFFIPVFFLACSVVVNAQQCLYNETMCACVFGSTAGSWYVYCESIPSLPLFPTFQHNLTPISSSYFTAMKKQELPQLPTYALKEHVMPAGPVIVRETITALRPILTFILSSTRMTICSPHPFPVLSLTRGLSPVQAFSLDIFIPSFLTMGSWPASVKSLHGGWMALFRMTSGIIIPSLLKTLQLSKPPSAIGTFFPLGLALS